MEKPINEDQFRPRYETISVRGIGFALPKTEDLMTRSRKVKPNPEAEKPDLD